MKVSEIISELQKMPPDADVGVHLGSRKGVIFIGIVGFKAQEVDMTAKFPDNLYDDERLCNFDDQVEGEVIDTVMFRTDYGFD